jgi:hypothetical protein
MWFRRSPGLESLSPGNAEAWHCISSAAMGFFSSRPEVGLAVQFSSNTRGLLFEPAT